LIHILFCAFVSGPSGRVLAQVADLQHEPTVSDNGFGYAVAMDSAGRLALVGSARASLDTDLRDNTGVVYVFKRHANTWLRTQRLTSSHVDMTDAFGGSVSLSEDGEVALVGAFMDEEGGLASGAAYVFAREGAAYVEHARLIAPEPRSGDWFGSRVLVDARGLRVIVAARGEGQFAGAVYVFDRHDQAWKMSDRLEPSESHSFSAFGHSLAADRFGETLVVGAPGEPRQAGTTGAVYVFEYMSGEWREQARIDCPLCRENAQFGYAVSLSADASRIAVGAVTDSDAERDAGAVYVFSRFGDSWPLEARIASPAGPDGWFGCAVDLAQSGRYLLAGARADGREGVLGGGAFLFERAGATWSLVYDIRKPAVEWSDQFGAAVALAGNAGHALIGAPGDPRLERESGSAWVFDVSTIVTDREAAAEPANRVPIVDIYRDPNTRDARIRVSGIPGHEVVHVEVYDTLGRKVGTLYEGRFPAAGELRLGWEAATRAAGRYLVRTSTEDASQTSVIVVVR
jgi:hypothetical protein